MTRLSGLFPALATPVTSSGAIDLGMLDRLCDFLLERGAAGLCLGGATAEYPRFETSERLDILRRVARRVPRGTVLLAAIGASSIERTLHLGRAAFDVGCPAVLLPMPWFFPYQQPDLAAYSAHIAQTLDGPCLLYDLPGFTSGLEADTTIGLLQSEPNLVGIKDSSGRVENLLRFVEARGNRDWTLLVGDDRNGLASAEAGWDGGISGIAACCPELLIALHTAARNGHIDQARHCQGLVDELITHLAPLPTPWGIRVALRVRGLDIGPMPLPISPERAAQMARIEAWLPGWLSSVDFPNLLPVPKSAR
jgi:4-hydroxy-tetrahydrodipicolinate synthase